MEHKDYTGLTIDQKYRVEHLLGAGGMGSVYLARHTVIGKKVAIKLLHLKHTVRETLVKRFYQEAQAAAAIEHPNIIDVSDVGISEYEEPYIVMEYLEGESLSSFLDRTGIQTPEVACAILIPVLSALAAAHARGIVHRDLKPQNIFLSRNNKNGSILIKLIDFGVSKYTQSDQQSNLTQTGALLGTPSYMSPEQARGIADVDHRSDIFSVGVILYRMLTGQKPFEGTSHNDIVCRLIIQEHDPPSVHNPDLPPRLERIISRCLAKDPNSRHQTADDLREALEGTTSVEDRDESVVELTATVCKRPAALGGDLGASVESTPSTNVAADIWQQVSSALQPPHQTMDRGLHQTGSTPSSSSPLKYLAMFVLAVVVVGAAAFVYFNGVQSLKLRAPIETTSNPVVAEPVSKTEPISDGQIVHVTFGNIQPETHIYTNGVLITDNPFPLRRGEMAVTFNVEQEGFQPLAVAVVPDKDKEVKLKLKPAVQKVIAPKRKRKPLTRRSRRKPSKKPNPVKSDPATNIKSSPGEDTSSGTFGINFTDEFE